MMRGLPAGLTGVIVLFATAVAAQMGPGAVRVQWPGMQTTWQHGSMYLASAPSEESMAYAKGRGITTVINLRESEEVEAVQGGSTLNEKSLTTSMGLRYEHLPLSVDHPSDEAVARFLSIVQEVQARNLLIHCDLAGRALAMYAIYLGTVEGYTPQQALAQAEAAGLKHEGLKKFVLSYLERHPAPV